MTSTRIDAGSRNCTLCAGSTAATPTATFALACLKSFLNSRSKFPRISRKLLANSMEQRKNLPRIACGTFSSLARSVKRLAQCRIAHANANSRSDASRPCWRCWRTARSWRLASPTAPPRRGSRIVCRGQRRRPEVLASSQAAASPARCTSATSTSIQYKGQEMLATYAQTSRYSQYEQGLEFRRPSSRRALTTRRHHRREVR